MKKFTRMKYFSKGLTGRVKKFYAHESVFNKRSYLAFKRLLHLFSIIRGGVEIRESIASWKKHKFSSNFFFSTACGILYRFLSRIVGVFKGWRFFENQFLFRNFPALLTNRNLTNSWICEKNGSYLKQKNKNKHYSWENWYLQII